MGLAVAASPPVFGTPSAQELELHFQPQVGLSTNRPLGVEALVRWRHPERGLLAPGAFLPDFDARAHDTLLAFVLPEALEWAARWRGAGRTVPVSVNVEPSSLRDDLPGLVAGALAATATPPGQLTLEVTEGSLAPATAADRCVQELRALGVRIALDDFGTGFSSLSRLHEVAVDELKVDRRFITAATHDGRARAIVGCVTALGRQLGVRTVAEGIETQVQVGLVRRLGFAAAQGYLYARPLPGDALTGWLAAA